MRDGVKSATSPKEDAMKTTKSNRKVKPSAKRAVKDLTTRTTGSAKGGSKLIQAKNDMQKGIIANFRV
jgi:hypothetical protein